ncbi:MAG: GT4 family glycosyltransferase PelF [Methyloversatilis sp.]|jgi:glycosyltransferase involved in cell wall biosynthesis|nr:GT4 family glycosyltransferase PelF [Methyloversatilis sp.]MBP6193355.1 GT4 family glycosyltransferase PelF [Methyloversatilis sp.]MBP9117935.1 GT4 family glycosyltransferase PelF [Methyloversatilis sp.]
MTNAELVPARGEVDVALLLEGTFPYVSGGVSSWVNQIIRAFPDLTFAVVFIGSRRSDYGDMRYTLPDNVTHIETHYLHEDLGSGASAHDRKTGRPGDAAGFDCMASLHDAFRGDDGDVHELFGAACRDIQPGGRVGLEDFLRSEASWDIVTDRYRKYCSDPSFVDYFWTVRIMHQPLWQLARVAHQLVPAKVYHSVSTGYAGFLGAMLAQSTGRPLVLSEHGIYTKERKIDLYQNEWIRDNRNVFQKDSSELSYFRQLWIRFFEWLGRLTYAAADPIIALYEINRLRQVADGADAARTRNIPNGVAIGKLAPLRAQRTAEVPRVLCLIGRVVPIKDIKTFIRAMRRVANRMPDVQGWIAGPADEDAAYAEECLNLVDSLGLGDTVHFLGMQKIDELMPKIGVVVLSSISEALPLVLLEGFAAGVPAVATDVGSCRQLIDGLGAEDEALGSAGRVVGIADPQALADAALDLLGDDAAWTAAQQAGIARVERYYSDARMFGSYREVYDQALARKAASGACPFGHGAR